MLLCSAVNLNAQMAVGDWKFFTSYPPGDVRSMVVNSAGKLYILSGINLFLFDPDTQETISFTNQTGLNGIKIDKIHYNKDLKLLAVAYDDGNLDFIHDDGRISNQNGISTANISGQRKIKCIASVGGKFYIGTDFGMVVIDGRNFRVLETGQYGVKRQKGSSVPVPYKGPDALEVVGNRLVAVFNLTEPDADSTKEDPNPPHTSTGHLFESDYTDSSKTYREADKFTFLCDITSDDIASVDDFHLASRRKDNNKDNNKVDFYEFPQIINGTCIVNKYKDYSNRFRIGFWKSDGKTYSFDWDYTMNTLTENMISKAFTGTRVIKNIFAVTAGDTSRDTWVATPEGIFRYDLTKDPIEMTYGPYKAYSPQVTNVSSLNLSPDGNRIYVSTRAASLFKSASGKFTNSVPDIGYNDYGYYTPGYIDIIENSTISPFSYTNDLYSFKSDSETGSGNFYTESSRKYYGNIIIAPNAVIQNPNNLSQLWIPTSNEGLYVIEGNRTIAIFSGTEDPNNISKLKYDNMPATGYGYGNQILLDVKFDSQGNLWVLACNQKVDDNLGQALLMLPAAYVNGDLSKIQKSDWIYKKSDGSFLIPEDFRMNCDGGIIPFRRSNVFVIKGAMYEGVVIYRHKGTYGNVDDDSYVLVESARDQDGNTINAKGVKAVCETPSGGLLMSYYDGLLLISNPETFDPQKDTVQRLKEPRNDGSGFADYLLNKVDVSDFAIDDAGRIWVATEGDGISILQPDLRGIVATYNTDNSKLPTNRISAIELDPANNIVYFGTTYGLGAFASDQSPAMEDFNTVRAYPNPVRPDYYGVITIDGLMEGSLVKITDAQGNVIYTGESIGGMMTWDGTNFNGRRVPSGVYYVMASQDGQSDGPKGKVACKILVLK